MLSVAAAPSIVRAYWVDPQLGDDNAIGTEASPFKTLQRAVDATPDGGRVTAVKEIRRNRSDQVLEIVNQARELLVKLINDLTTHSVNLRVNS